MLNDCNEENWIYGTRDSAHGKLDSGDQLCKLDIDHICIKNSHTLVLLCY